MRRACEAFSKQTREFCLLNETPGERALGRGFLFQAPCERDLRGGGMEWRVLSLERK